MRSPDNVQWRQDGFAPRRTVLRHLHPCNTDQGLNPITEPFRGTFRNGLDGAIINSSNNMVNSIPEAGADDASRFFHEKNDQKDNNGSVDRTYAIRPSPACTSNKEAKSER